VRILVSWLREFVDVPLSADELAGLLSMRGFALEDLESAPPGHAPDDAVLDVEVTANRPDCLNVVGIAREVATACDLPLRVPGRDREAPLEALALTPGDGGDVAVELEAPDLCPRFTVAVADVTIGPSPGWLATRLLAAGVRPINNIVDITNYVLLELGQPMHAYDLERLADRTLRIRCAREAERVRTLDGELRTAAADMLVIADTAQAQGFGGVMGGAESEVSPGTRVVAFEAANFEPTSVRRTSKRLALKTEAAARFERGADIDGPVAAQERACALLHRIGAGRARGTIVDRYPAPRRPVQSPLRRSRIERLVGDDVAPADVTRILGSLGFDVTAEPGDGAGSETWLVDVPARRVDVTREIDLVEEVARHHGYDRVPTTFPVLADMPPPPDARIARDRRLRQLLRAAGYSEAVTFTFVERAAIEAIDPEADTVAIANPLSELFAVMRPSLWPGLVDSIAHNRRRAQRDVRLFEIGSRFSATAGESRVVAMVATGAATDPHWSGGSRELDFFDLSGLTERLCAAQGVQMHLARTERPQLIAGRTALVRAAVDGADPIDVGLVGQLAPSAAAARDLPPDDAVWMAELDLDAIARIAPDAGDRGTRPLPRYPSIVRDVSLLVAESLPAAALRGTIRAAAPDTLASVREFDRYQGAGIPEHAVSLSFRLTFRSFERTLTDDEVQGAMTTIVAALEREHGTTLR
jgi:phenylalanyl-tRNA synthetase beta chain